MPEDALEFLVLRMPGAEGNFLFHVAKMKAADVLSWENRVNAGEFMAVRAELPATFEGPMNLMEAMLVLPPDFHVLNVRC